MPVDAVLRDVFRPAALAMSFPFRQNGIIFERDPLRLAASAVVNVFLAVQVVYLAVSGSAYEYTFEIAFCYRLQITCLCLVPLINVFWFCTNLSGLNDIAANLDYIDLRLKALGLTPEYSASTTLFNTIFTVCGVMFCLDIFMAYMQYDWTMAEVFIFFAILLPSLVITFQIKSLLKVVDNLMQLVSDSIKSNRQNLVSTISIFHNLCKVTQVLNRLCGPQIIALLTATFTGVVVNSFYVIDDSSSDIGPLRIVVAVCDSVLWTSMYSACVWIVVDAHESVAEKAKEFNNLLYQVMINDRTNQLSKNKTLRLHIAMKREVVFTACGYFNLDYTLVHSMIAAATTYLVILIQFGQPNSSDSAIPPHTASSTEAPVLTTTKA